ncbi:hypothetical protein G3I59_07980 [Amycolatopsis rubida]|uniref:PPE family protein n=1 Tax=Amycolatopsis rubida TaxID=112413 RepID=A0ABX0BRT0_9PSEU|nr:MULTISPECIES: hypothetical protein [Amycolatopsis]MYW90559.1 hypothetical protein [Amycolatopsis rubida]NEC55540.1 hypothetical protein [Amycolatopsis rubida]OAP22271.1 hypothetical protein A4R44_07081 [Amycolatopsis sp. M39]
MGFFDFIGEGAQWIGDRIGDADDWVNDRLRDAGNWFSDFYHGNLGDQALPAPAIVQQVQQGPGTSSWDSGSSTVQKMIQEHNQNSDDAQQITTMLESVWTGDGADAARARLRPLSDASSTSAQAYVVNGQKLVDTTHGYNDMKIALQAMPPAPPHKNLWDQGTPWDTDTEKQINEYNAAANHNVERYQKYADQARANGQGLNSDYGQVSGFDGQNLTIDSGGDRAKSKTGSHERASQKPGQDSGGPGSGPGASGGLGSGPGTVGGPGSWPGASGGPGASGPGASGPGATGGAGGVSFPPGGVAVPLGSGVPGGNDGTSTAGWTPPSVDRVGGANWTPPTATPTSWGAGGGSGNSGWTPGGFGPLGGGSDAGSEAGGRSGGIVARLGGGTGVGAGAGVGAGEEAAARGAAGKGAAGAKGSPGMGGMAGAGKGKGEEDKVHQRKYGIDDDSAFSLVDENGERALDPRTGLPPTPPTIGG